MEPSREAILSDMILDEHLTGINLKINVTEKQPHSAEFIGSEHQQSPSEQFAHFNKEDYPRPQQQIKNITRQRELLNQMMMRNLGRHKKGK